jgi:ATP-dependent DNA helicase RecQ
VKDYAKEKGLESKIAYKSPKKERKAASARPAQPIKARKTNDTRTESLRLYQTGKTIAEIATDRTYRQQLSKAISAFLYNRANWR